MQGALCGLLVIVDACTAWLGGIKNNKQLYVLGVSVVNIL
jgi:hypothetical protein